MSIEIAGYDHIVLRVKDLEKMIDFYSQVLGAKVLWRRPDFGLVHLRIGPEMIDFVPVDGPLGVKGGAAPGAEARNLDHFCFRVLPFDQDAIVKHLEAHNVKVGEIRTRFGSQGTGVSIYLSDPEDNIVELKGPGDGKMPS